MKISTRIQGKVTSLTIKDSICALYYLICADPEEDSPRHFILDACYDIVSQWPYSSARGLSSYVTDELLKQVLSPEDLEEYEQILNTLQST